MNRVKSYFKHIACLESFWNYDVVNRLSVAHVNGNVQDFWILEQSKLLSVKEALSELEERDGLGILIDT